MNHVALRLLPWPCWVGYVCVVPLAGCGGKPAGYPDTAPVNGTITLDGAPLEGASVSFSPVDGRSSSGKTDAQE